MADEKGHQHRQLLDELIASEKSYFESLSTCYEHYFIPLQNSATGIDKSLGKKTKDYGVTVEMMDKLFGNFTSIRTLHQMVYEDLERSKRGSDRTDAVIEALQKLLPGLVIYQTYVKNYDNSSQCLEKLLRNSSEFQKFQDKVRQNGQGVLDLQSYLIQPIQRPPRYRLLLEGLIKKTEPDTPTYTVIQGCLKKCNTLVSDINGNNKSVVMDKVVTLAESLGDAFSLIKPGRSLIASYRVNSKHSILWLFTDIILVTTKTYQYQKNRDLEGLNYDIIDDREETLLQDRWKGIKVSFSTRDDMHAFNDKLRDAQQVIHENIANRRRSQQLNNSLDGASLSQMPYRPNVSATSQTLPVTSRITPSSPIEQTISPLSDEELAARNQKRSELRRISEGQCSNVRSKVAAFHLDQMEREDENIRIAEDIMLDRHLRSSIPKRTLIRSGFLKKKTRRGPRKYVFRLFNDTLTYSDENGKLHKEFDLRYCSVEAGDKETNSFLLLCSYQINEQSYAIICESAKEKDMWVNDLKKFCTSSATTHAPVFETDNRKDCTLCGAKFNVCKRKHHCRICGVLVCEVCGKKKLLLAEGKGGERRVCDTCYKTFETMSPPRRRRRKQKRHSEAFPEGNLDLPSLEILESTRDTLKEQINDAAKIQDFEKCQRLDDGLRKIENGIKKKRRQSMNLMQRAEPVKADIGQWVEAENQGEFLNSEVYFSPSQSRSQSTIASPQHSPRNKMDFSFHSTRPSSQTLSYNSRPTPFNALSPVSTGSSPSSSPHASPRYYRPVSPSVSTSISPRTSPETSPGTTPTTTPSTTPATTPTTALAMTPTSDSGAVGTGSEPPRMSRTRKITKRFTNTLKRQKMKSVVGRPMVNVHLKSSTPTPPEVHQAQHEPQPNGQPDKRDPQQFGTFPRRRRRLTRSVAITPKTPLDEGPSTMHQYLSSTPPSERHLITDGQNGGPSKEPPKPPPRRPIGPKPKRAPPPRPLNKPPRPVPPPPPTHGKKGIDIRNNDASPPPLPPLPSLERNFAAHVPGHDDSHDQLPPLPPLPPLEHNITSTSHSNGDSLPDLEFNDLGEGDDNVSPLNGRTLDEDVPPLELSDGNLYTKNQVEIHKYKLEIFGLKEKLSNMERELSHLQGENLSDLNDQQLHELQDYMTHALKRVAKRRTKSK